jgi:hypothetical protein
MHKFSILRSLFATALWYIGWLYCVNRASENDPFTGSLFVLFVLVLHLIFSRTKLVDLILIVSLALMGTLIDTVFLQTGMIQYKALYAHFPGIAPLWITALWALFAISIHTSMSWLRGNIFLEMVFGAFGGPASYLVAVKMGAADFGVPVWIAVIILAATWSLVIPFCFRLSDWIESR